MDAIRYQQKPVYVIGVHCFANYRHRKKMIQQQYHHRKHYQRKLIPVHLIDDIQKPVYSILGKKIYLKRGVN